MSLIFYYFLEKIGDNRHLGELKHLTSTVQQAE